VNVIAAPRAIARSHWFNQPPGLAILFLTQMWEIFSYYGMRTLLVYYMTKQLLFGQQHASLVYGVYVATFYFTPIVGGVISDRWLGRKRSVIIGAAIMSIGHFLMASESLLYFALAAIALGNGLFLPSLPSQIDDLYAKDDPVAARRTTSITWASTSAACWHRSCAARSASCMAGTGASARRASACCWAL
jgi:POT family proton-dependent oligopeptide transporter